MVPFSFESVARASDLDALNLPPSRQAESRRAEESFQSHMDRSEPPAQSSARPQPADEPREDSSSPAVVADSDDHTTDSDPAVQAEEEPQSSTTQGDSDSHEGEEQEDVEPAVVASAEVALVDATELAADVAEDNVEGGDAGGGDERELALSETDGETQDGQELIALPDESLKHAGSDTGQAVEAEDGEIRVQVDRQGSAVRTAAHDETKPDSEGPPQVDDREPTRRNEPTVPVDTKPTDVERQAARVGQQVPVASQQAPRREDPQTERTDSQPRRADQLPVAGEGEGLVAEESDGADSSGKRHSSGDRPGLQSAGRTTVAGGEQTEATPLGRFAQHLWARSGDANGKGLELSEGQQARFVDRVARAFQAAEGRGGTLRLRLHPPELGSLRLEVRVQGGALIARLEADTPVARTLLLDNLPMLRDRLAEQGVRVEQFDVDLLDRQAGNPAEGSSQQERRGGDSSTADTRAEEGDEPPEEPQHLRWRGDDEQLDVTI